MATKKNNTKAVEFKASEGKKGSVAGALDKVKKQQADKAPKAPKQEAPKVETPAPEVKEQDAQPLTKDQAVAILKEALSIYKDDPSMSAEEAVDEAIGLANNQGTIKADQPGDGEREALIAKFNEAVEAAKAKAAKTPAADAAKAAAPKKPAAPTVPTFDTVNLPDHYEFTEQVQEADGAKVYKLDHLVITEPHKSLIEWLLQTFPGLELIEKVNYFTLKHPGTGRGIVFSVERTKDPSKFTFLGNREAKGNEQWMKLVKELSLKKEMEGHYYDKDGNFDNVKRMATLHWELTVVPRLKEAAKATKAEAPKQEAKAEDQPKAE